MAKNFFQASDDESSLVNPNNTTRSLVVGFGVVALEQETLSIISSMTGGGTMLVSVNHSTNLVSSMHGGGTMDVDLTVIPRKLVVVIIMQ